MITLPVERANIEVGTRFDNGRKRRVDADTDCFMLYKISIFPTGVNPTRFRSAHDRSVECSCFEAIGPRFLLRRVRVGTRVDKVSDDRCPVDVREARVVPYVRTDGGRGDRQVFSLLPFCWMKLRQTGRILKKRRACISLSWLFCSGQNPSNAEPPSGTQAT